MLKTIPNQVKIEVGATVLLSLKEKPKDCIKLIVKLKCASATPLGARLIRTLM
jgi:hypothetical protein